MDVIVTNPVRWYGKTALNLTFPLNSAREAADLLWVLIMKLLKPGGRAGLVLPDGTLFGEA